MFSFSFLTFSVLDFIFSVLDFKFEAMDTQKNLGVALLPHHVPGGKVLRHWDLQQSFELADRDQRVAQFSGCSDFTFRD
jgi:hypothetical protein